MGAAARGAAEPRARRGRMRILSVCPLRRLGSAALGCRRWPTEWPLVAWPARQPATSTTGSPCASGGPAELERPVPIRTGGSATSVATRSTHASTAAWSSRSRPLVATWPGRGRGRPSGRTTGGRWRSCDCGCSGWMTTASSKASGTVAGECGSASAWAVGRRCGPTPGGATATPGPCACTGCSKSCATGRRPATTARAHPRRLPPERPELKRPPRRGLPRAAALPRRAPTSQMVSPS
jgi:hypothetical protein